MKVNWAWQNQDKWVVKTERGYTLVIVMELRKLMGKKIKIEFPEGYQFKIHAYNLVNPNEFVRVDNHNNKPPHYHVDQQEKPFVWVSWEESKQLFYQLTCQRFGNFPWD